MGNNAPDHPEEKLDHSMLNNLTAGTNCEAIEIVEFGNPFLTTASTGNDTTLSGRVVKP